MKQMIRKREIEQKAEAQNVPKATIDKDWVLGHFLDAIYSVPECREKLVFKGGTCLRKCYFPNYRFSEDLDFTSIDPNFVLDNKLLTQITAVITDRTEIPLHIQEITEMRFNDQLTGYKAIVKFWGADHSSNQAPPPVDRWNTSVKIEIILYESMIFPIESREVFHPYSDQLSETPLIVPCYSLREVIAEKLRALIQRSYTAPRDFYDIWYLSNDQSTIDWYEIKSAFHEKMRFKNIEFEGTHQMLNDTNDKRVKAAWQNSLGHQIPGGANPTYEEVKEYLTSLLDTIFNK
jgi:predicted nucleotidyltransferase component of viral defense system